MIGKNFNDYTILKLLGSGGMGKVYLALQKSLDREVAIKIITFNSPLQVSNEVIERFLREAKIAASLQHPNIVNIYSAGREENFFYIVMEYIQGSSLDNEIAKSHLPETFVWNVAVQICGALQLALQNQIIHRDIKPANILLTAKKAAKLTDFGLSKRMNENSHLTQAGVILGTPNYISPEQASGEPVDFRSDIYSLGATLYHALTGHPVFKGEAILDVIFKHKFELVKPPEDVVPSLRKETSAIIGKMLNKNPKDRYQSYNDLLSDIQALQNNKPLPIAKDNTAFMAYRERPGAGQKTRKLFGSLFSMMMTGSSGSTTSSSAAPAKPAGENKAKQQFNHFIVVSQLAQQELQACLDKYSPLKVSISTINSLSDLKVCLKLYESVVILENNFLGPQIVDFCDGIRREFAENPLLILLDSVSPKEKLPDGVVCIRYEGNAEKLARQLPIYLTQTALKAGGVTLSLLLSIARQAGWTTSLYVNQGTEDSGVIELQKGEVAQVRQQQLRGDLALRSLSQYAQSWQITPLSQIVEQVNNHFTAPNLLAPHEKATAGGQTKAGKVSHADMAQTLAVSPAFLENNEITSQLAIPAEDAPPAPPAASSTQPAPAAQAATPSMQASASNLAATPPAGQTSVGSASASWGNIEDNIGCKILLLDNEHQRGEAMAEQLAGNGAFMAMYVGDVGEAMTLLQIETFDIVISRGDILTAQGQPFYQEVQNHFPNSLQIIFSSDLSKKTNVFYFNANITFVEKDCEIATLLQAIQLWQSSRKRDASQH